MNILRLLFFGMWLLVGLWCLACEMDFITEGFLGHSPMLSYAFSTLCVITAVGGSWLACRLLAFPRIKQEVETDKTGRALKKWSAIRLSINSLAIFPSAICYYGLTDTTALYCMLLALTASLLCIPKV